LAHFFPRLKVRLVDGASTVLPQLDEKSQSYAYEWLKEQGVTMHLGRPFSPESLDEDDLVIWCMGSASRSDDMFVDTRVMKQHGRIRVNRKMQVLRRVEGDSMNEPLGQAQAMELEPLGGGKVFAIGDAAMVEGVPTAQMIYHGEEMAAVAVANIEAAEDIASPLAIGKGRREKEAMPLLCCTSLGPQDGMFSTQNELIATGGFAALQKQLIEDTKMGALQGDVPSSLLWYPLH
jgi:NADH dehydrogenase FAD-containing subunit